VRNPQRLRNHAHALADCASSSRIELERTARADTSPPVTRPAFDAGGDDAGTSKQVHPRAPSHAQLVRSNAALAAGYAQYVPPDSAQRAPRSEIGRAHV
jgi:hypothetical protein